MIASANAHMAGSHPTGAFVSRPVTDRVAAERLARLICSDNGLTEPELIRLSMTATFRSGSTVLRVGHFDGDLDGAVQLAELLRAKGISAPRPLGVHQLDESSGLAAVLYEFIEGNALPVDWRAVGVLAQRLHTEVSADMIPRGVPLVQPTSLPWWQFDEMLNDIEERELVEQSDVTMLRDVVQAAGEWRAIFDDAPLVVTHGDLHPGNILMTPDGPVLVDWDLLAHAPTSWDHVPLAAWSGGPWLGAGHEYEQFVEGYGSVSADVERDIWQLATLRNVAATLMRIRAGESSAAAAVEAQRRLEYWKQVEFYSLWRAV